jgi:hypothetical protein
MKFTKNDPRCNRKGRPKKEFAITKILNELGDIEDVKIGETFVSKKTALARIMWREALKGDRYFANIILERLEGKALAKMEHSGPDGQPLQLDISKVIDNMSDEELKEKIKELNDVGGKRKA